MTMNQAIAFGLQRSRDILISYIGDLSAGEYLHRPTAKANCAAWTVGHLILTDRRALALLGADVRALPDGFEKRFSRDAGCAEAQEFGDVGGLGKLFDEHRMMLIEAVKKADAAILATPLETPSPRFGTIGEMLVFFAVHTSMHAGQVTTIRRSLGRPPLV